MGSSCYMTSVLESMVHNPLIRNFYLSDGHKPATCHKALANKPCLSCNMDEMFQQFNNTESTTAFSAHRILGSLVDSNKSAYAGLVPDQHQDAHEFLNFLLEELHDVNSWQPGDDSSEDDGSPSSTPSTTKRRKVDEVDCKCVVHQTFYGKTINVTKCMGEVDGKKCGHVSSGNPEMFSDLSLGLSLLPPAKKPHKLDYCLRKEYFTEEQFEWTCDKCGSKSATKQVSIKTLPNVLCIQLKVSFLPLPLLQLD
jgi:ubiquitin carboxyl-terminal hydrolase 22/27/51